MILLSLRSQDQGFSVFGGALGVFFFTSRYRVGDCDKRLSLDLFLRSFVFSLTVNPIYHQILNRSKILVIVWFSICFLL